MAKKQKQRENDAVEMLDQMLGGLPDEENWMGQDGIISALRDELKNRGLMCMLMGLESELKNSPEVLGVSFSGDFESDDQGGSYFSQSVQLKARVDAEGQADPEGGTVSDWEYPGDLGLDDLGDELTSSFTNSQGEALDGFSVEFESARGFTQKVGARLLSEEAVGKWLSAVEVRQLEKQVPKAAKRAGPKGL